MNTPDDVASLADEPLDALDASILDALAQTWTAHDPPPDGLTDRLKFAMAVAALEAEVARIVTAEPAAVRSVTFEHAHSVTFVADTMSAMVTVEDDGAGTVTVRGWTSRSRVDVELRERGRSRQVSVDDEGRFEFTTVQRGLVQFVLRRTDDPDAKPVLTPALEL